jgi:hypothetical protein
MTYLIIAAAALAAAAAAPAEAAQAAQAQPRTMAAQPAQATAASPAPAPVDPQRLAIAAVIAEQIFPEGALAKVMAASSEGSNSMIDGFLDMDVRDVAAAGEDPLSPELAGKTVSEVMAEQDPHFRERTEISNRVMMSEMLPIMTRFEPQARAALARAYARRFTLAQLTDIRAFFASPSGRAYAAESMMLAAEPEFMQAMGGFVPDLMKEMPAILGKIADATAHLPPPPQPEAEHEHAEHEHELEQPKRAKKRR